MINYSAAPLASPEYVDITPGGDVVELGQTERFSSDGAYFSSEIRPSLGVYDRSGKLTNEYTPSPAFKLTRESVAAVTQAINHVKQLLFLGVPKEIIRSGFAANVKTDSPDSELQYKLVDLFIGD